MKPRFPLAVILAAIASLEAMQANGADWRIAKRLEAWRRELSKHGATR